MQAKESVATWAGRRNPPTELFAGEYEAATVRSDAAMLCMFAELNLASPEKIAQLRAEGARRRQRISPIDAVHMLRRAGIQADIFAGDMQDLEDLKGPVLAIMESSCYVLVLLVDRRAVIARAGMGVVSHALRQSAFDKSWKQLWIAPIPSAAAGMHG